MSECNLQPGWLLKQLKENAVSVATFPKFMRESFADSILTAEERKEAARRLRERADELDPKESAQPPAPTWAEVRSVLLPFAHLAERARSNGLGVNDHVSAAAALLSRIPEGE